MSFDSSFPPPETRLSRKALWSFILGLLGCTCVAAIPSLALGIWGLSEISSRPAELRGRGLAICGIVFSGLSILLLPVTLILVALLLPAVQAAREAARRSECRNNLKQIAIALHNYHDAYGSFPPPVTSDENGKPLHSWRALILPFLESPGVKYNFDEPWNGPNNSKLLAAAPPVFRCPSGDAPPELTGYVVIAGPNAMFRGATRGVQLRDISDGTSNTILVAETDVEVPWLEPRDLDTATLPAQVGAKGGIASHHPGGAQVAMGDASVHFLADDTSPETLRALITPRGRENVQATPDGDWIETGGQPAP